LLQVFQLKTCMHLSSHHHLSYIPHLMFLELIILIVFDEEYKL
jgi:hypothetical protein